MQSTGDGHVQSLVSTYAYLQATQAGVCMSPKLGMGGGRGGSRMVDVATAAAVFGVRVPDFRDGQGR